MSPEPIRLQGRVRDVRALDLNEGDSLDTLARIAFERGRVAGVVEGRLAARDEHVALLDLTVERVEAAREEAVGELSRAAIELAIEIARGLLRKEIKAENYGLEEIVRKTLEEAAVGRGPCVVHLNPADHKRLEDVRFRTGTTIQADDGVPLGDVHVETSLGLMVRETMGSLDAIEKRLQEKLS